MQSLNNFLLKAHIKASSFLAAAGYGGLTDGIDKADQKRLEELKGIMNSVLYIFIAIIGGAMLGIGVYYGFKYAAAKKADKVEEAKSQIKRLFVGMIISVVIGIVGGIGISLVKKNVLNK